MTSALQYFLFVHNLHVITYCTVHFALFGSTQHWRIHRVYCSSFSGEWTPTNKRFRFFSPHISLPLPSLKARWKLHPWISISFYLFIISPRSLYTYIIDKFLNFSIIEIIQTRSLFSIEISQTISLYHKSVLNQGRFQDFFQGVAEISSGGGKKKLLGTPPSPKRFLLSYTTLPIYAHFFDILDTL